MLWFVLGVVCGIIGYEYVLGHPGVIQDIINKIKDSIKKVRNK